MGGVDLADMLIALYRIAVKTKRWYLKIFWHCVDIAKVNAWLLYRRHCDELGIAKRNQMSLLNFILATADALILANKSALTPGGRQGRPPKRKSIDDDSAATKAGRKPVTPKPCNDARLDQFDHWPEPDSKRGRCRHCKSGYSQIYCSKCKVCLCLKNSANCFKKFHGQ